MILNEIKNITESQVYPESGLSHGFNNYELAKKIYSAVEATEPDENLMALRKTAMKREAKLQFALSQTQNNYEQDSIRQEIMLLNGAIDHLDHHLRLYKRGYVHAQDSPMGQYGLSPKGYALKRRYQRDAADSDSRGRGSSKKYDPNDPRYL